MKTEVRRRKTEENVAIRQFDNEKTTTKTMRQYASWRTSFANEMINNEINSPESLTAF